VCLNGRIVVQILSWHSIRSRLVNWMCRASNRDRLTGKAAAGSAAARLIVHVDQLCQVRGVEAV
jgi:hypothetical protein